MARFKMRLGLAETENEATFEVNGSDEWLHECLPYLGYIMGAMVKAHGEDPKNVAAVGNELSAARTAVMEDRDYQGLFVSVTRS